MTEIGLVSCTKSKREEAAQPAELSMPSTFFSDPIRTLKRITTAGTYFPRKTHLLDPSGTINTYDETLTGAPAGPKREWASVVYDQLEDKGLLDDDNRLVFHTGRDYYKELIPLLDKTSSGSGEVSLSLLFAHNGSIPPAG